MIQIAIRDSISPLCEIVGDDQETIAEEAAQCIKELLEPGRFPKELILQITET